VAVVVIEGNSGMSFVDVTPELIESAAQDLAAIRSALSESSAAAAPPTTELVAAAEDEVSAAIASLFGDFGQEFQVLSARASAFHDEFVRLLNAGAGAYISTELSNAKNNLLDAVNAPAQGLLGQPSTAAANAAAPGQNLAKLGAAAQAAEGGFAEGTAGVATALQQAVAAGQLLQPAYAELLLAGGAFATAGVQAAAGIASLSAAAANLVGGLTLISAGVGSVVGAVGLLGTAAVELFTPATWALAATQAVAGVGLLGTGAISIVSGVSSLLLIGGQVTTGIAQLQAAATGFSQGVGYLSSAWQAAAPGLAALQTAGAQFGHGLADMQTGVGSAVAVLTA
jgi:hypothetical protein